jgi:AbrB family transcriptional regulator, transcriptional pleiotropic regulator of transition state genes
MNDVIKWKTTTDITKAVKREIDADLKYSEIVAPRGIDLIEKRVVTERKGLIRAMDSLGRIVVPKHWRKSLCMDIGDEVEFFFEDEHIVIKRKTLICTFCEGEKDVSKFEGKGICEICIEKLFDTV